MSTDPNYNTRDAADVLVTNTDNDTAGITVTPPPALSPPRRGGTTTFTVVLNTHPTAAVTIGVSSAIRPRAPSLRSSLLFTTANWSAPQRVGHGGG